MATTALAPTRPVLIGLLLAALSAGSFIAFSLVAGNTTVTPRAGVQAAGPATGVAPVVLGTRVSNEKTSSNIPASEDTRPDITEVAAAAEVETEVLGKRVRNRARNNQSGGGSTAATNPNGKDDSSSAPCACDGRNNDHSSNGNAYGHYKDKAQGNAYGHTGSPGNAHGKGPKKK